MVLGLAVSVDVNGEAARAAQHFVVEGIVPVVLRAYPGECLGKHRQEKPQVSRQALQVGLDAHIADAICRLLIEMSLHSPYVLHLRVCELDGPGDVG